MFTKLLKEKAAAKATQMALFYLDKDPDKSIPKLMSWWERVLQNPLVWNRRRTSVTSRPKLWQPLTVGNLSQINYGKTPGQRTSSLKIECSTN